MKKLLHSSVIAISFSLSLQAQIFDITSFGAVGNGSTVNTSAIQQAIDSCHNNGGGIVEVPAGNFVTGTLFLKSNVTIHISSGGTITGSSNYSDYPDVIPQIKTYTDNYPQKSVFYAENENNIAITGEGTFNGNGTAIAFLLDMDNRPFGFRFFSCSNIRYEGLKLRNSAFWMMHNFNIDTLLIKNLDIVNHCYGNNDGINVDCCREVLVDSCSADCNDDPLVMKTTHPMGSENIEIRNCAVSTYSRALKMGTETHGPYKNVYVHDITVEFSTQGPFGTNSPASCGINLSAVDGGSLENVLFENISMTGIKTPITVRLGNRARKYTDTAATPGVGYINNVELRNITATATTNVTSTVTGIPNYRAENIRLKNIDITMPGGMAALDSSFVVPENEGDKPEANIFGDTLPAFGLYARHIDSLQLQHVCFHTLQTDFRPAVVFDDVLNLDSSNSCVTSSPNETFLNEDDVKVLPNPFADRFTVYSTSFSADNEIELKVYDVTGSEVIRERNTNRKLEITTGDWRRGIYFLQFFSGKEVVVKKIMKM